MKKLTPKDNPEEASFDQLEAVLLTIDGQGAPFKKKVLKEIKLRCTIAGAEYVKNQIPSSDNP